MLSKQYDEYFVIQNNTMMRRVLQSSISIIGHAILDSNSISVNSGLERKDEVYI